MASLKDIKTRISSVKTTRQVTSAMKMVSAAKLKKAQDDIYHIRPFTSRLAGIIHDLMPSVDEYDRWFMSPGKGDKVLVIAIASNRGLCGAFNQNIVREVSTLLSTTLKEDSAKGNIHLVVLGKQAEKMFTSRRIH
ncbi:MAG TPA: F0F1 ATP synthase subunit gamma, partial [Bacteroidales bacterium]|nr:F0F1 ATP synthase subunit gamma [Bacteroidales bacterium]